MQTLTTPTSNPTNPRTPEPQRRKPGRPRKHNKKTPKTQDPIGQDFEKACITTRTYTVKIDGLQTEDLKEWFEFINIVDKETAQIGEITKKKISVFKNCFTIVMVDREKPITIKIYKNGSFQLTGCKNLRSCEFCVITLIDIIWLKGSRVSDLINISIRPVMTNLTFTIGFEISSDKSLRFFNNSEEHDFIAYRVNSPALNIKKPLTDESLELVPMTRFSLRGTGQPSKRQRENWDTNVLDYIQELPPAERAKHMKTRYTTMLLFRSGCVIMSGIHESVLKPVFQEFQAISLEHRKEIS